LLLLEEIVVAILDAYQEVSNLLNLEPREIYHKIYDMRGITNKHKLTIIHACLECQKNLDLKTQAPEAALEQVDIAVHLAIANLRELALKKGMTLS
jgi:hypothetical protein